MVLFKILLTYTINLLILLLKLQIKVLWTVFAVDSKEELEFTKTLDSNERSSCFMKLSNSFKIDTPLGTYNPELAIYIKDVKNKIYFIVETKGTDIFSESFPTKQDKIRCARKHFETVTAEVVAYAPVKEGHKWLSSL